MSVADTDRDRGRNAAKPPGGHDDSAEQRAGDWARRAPLLPALVFTIIVTQLPFVSTLVISFMNWNAYYPDERGLRRHRQLPAGAHRRQHPRRGLGHHPADRGRGAASASSSAWASRCCWTASSAAAASSAR